MNWGYVFGKKVGIFNIFHFEEKKWMTQLKISTFGYLKAWKDPGHDSSGKLPKCWSQMTQTIIKLP